MFKAAPMFYFCQYIQPIANLFFDKNSEYSKDMTGNGRGKKGMCLGNSPSQTLNMAPVVTEPFVVGCHGRGAAIATTALQGLTFFTARPSLTLNQQYLHSLFSDNELQWCGLQVKRNCPSLGTKKAA